MASKERAMTEPNDADRFDTLSAIWMMANRDEQPLMFYGDVAYRLRRPNEDKLKEYVREAPELFRLGVPKWRLHEWRCNKLVQAGFSTEDAPTEWRCNKRELDKKKGFPAWLEKKTGPERDVEKVVKVLEEIGENDVFRSQWRVGRDDKVASPIEVVEWGFEYLDRRRQARLEAQMAALETQALAIQRLEANIKRWQVGLVAVVGVISIIANIIVNVWLK
jgi:hypothetical protein